jgi:prevent-host-death family protein
METIAAAKFKEQCLALMDRLGPDGLVITKHGRPIAKLIPVARADGELIGSLRGRLVVHGDALSTGQRWDADAEP